MSFSLHGLSIGKGLGEGGIAIGRAVLIAYGHARVNRYLIPASQATQEIEQLQQAIDAVEQELEHLLHEVAQSHQGPYETTAILEVHLMLLRDQELWDGVKQHIRERHYNAAWALVTQLEVLGAQFDLMRDAYIRERKADLEQMGEHVLTQLQHMQTQTVVDSKAEPQPPTWAQASTALILVAHDLSPAQILKFNKKTFAGFVTDVGGKTSHSAIVGQRLGVAALVGVKHATQLIRADDWLIVDANVGVLTVNPSQQVLQDYRMKQAQAKAFKRADQATRPQTLLASDGSAITLMANIELPEDAQQALAYGAQGIGLFRTEFLFMGRTAWPSEQEQYEAYRRVVETMQGRPVTIRTIDIGADKLLDVALQADQPNESLNPALGLRAVRWCLAQPHMFLTQLRALLRAAAHGRIEVLIPMLVHEDEIKQCLVLLETAKAQLQKANMAYGQIGLGAMIEVPAAALIVPTFLQTFDFLVIGTNDLIQYTLAVDRNNEAVAHLYDANHPAVQTLIRMTVEHANAANKPVSVCGAMASDPERVQNLLALGLRRFSMPPTQIPGVRARLCA